MEKKKRKDELVELECAEFTYKVDGEDKSVKVYHNLPSVKGLSISDAFTNWVYRTPEHSSESFCDYVNSKSTGCFCITQEQLDRLKKEEGL